MKKQLALLLCLVMALANVSAFAQGNPYEVTEAVTVEWWHALEDQYSPTINEILADFHEKNPLITVQPIYVGNYRDVNERYVAAVAAGDLPGLIVSQVDFLANYGATDLCEPLQPYVDATGLDIADFGDGFIDTATVDDELIAMPFLHSTQVIYYNRDQADAENLTFPEKWEDMDAFLEKATVFNPDGTTARYGMIFGGWISWYFETIFFNSGVNIINDDGLTTDVNSEASVAITTKIKEWIDKGYCSFAYGTGASSDIRQLFWDQKAFSIVNTSSLFETFKSNAPFNLGITWYPSVNGNVDSSMGGCMLVIPRRAPQKQKNAAWTLLTYLTSPEVNMVWAEATGYLPTRKSVLTSPEALAYASDKYGFDIVFNHLDNVKACNSNPKYSAISNIWRDQLALIFMEDAPIQAILDETAVLIQEMLED